MVSKFVALLVVFEAVFASITAAPLRQQQEIAQRQEIAPPAKSNLSTKRKQRVRKKPAKFIQGEEDNFRRLTRKRKRKAQTGKGEAHQLSRKRSMKQKQGCVRLVSTPTDHGVRNDSQAACDPPVTPLLGLPTKTERAHIRSQQEGFSPTQKEVDGNGEFPSGPIVRGREVRVDRDSSTISLKNADNFAIFTKIS